MGKPQKLFEKWADNTPVDARLDEVIRLLDHYFPEMWDQKKGSHIVVRCEQLRVSKDFQPHGEITIPVKGGQKVKGYYIKRLVRAIALMQELEKLYEKRT